PPGQAANALSDCLLQGVGDVRRADRIAARVSELERDAEELLDMQGDPVGPLEDGCDDVGRSGPTKIEDLAGHERRLLERQPTKPGFLGKPFIEQTCAPFAHRDARVELIAPIRPYDEERQAAKPMS